MRALLIILFSFYSTLSLCQNTRFIYEYTSVPDTLNYNERLKTYMYLDVSDNRSLFFSTEKFFADSTMVHSINHAMPANKKYILYRIVKDYDRGTQLFSTSLDGKLINVNDHRNQDWKVEPEMNVYLNMKVQKAVTIFGGRKWIAWFTNEIPISDGPYKFHGLPGLIIKIEDENRTHIFNLIAIKKNIAQYEYPITNRYSKPLSLSQNEYSKLIKDYRKDPAKDWRNAVLAGKIVERDQYGNEKNLILEIKNREREYQERVKKDNNPIELDLIIDSN